MVTVFGAISNWYLKYSLFFFILSRTFQHYFHENSVILFSTNNTTNNAVIMYKLPNNSERFSASKVIV